MLAARFAEQLDGIAAGLVGDGSECFGFDDHISRDHDWGAAVCCWLTKQDHEAFGKQLQYEIDALPRTFKGFPARTESSWGGGRTGVFEISQFYQHFIGCDHVPQSTHEWIRIPEGNLAAATNGAVFTDGRGEFTRFRDALLAFYPRDVWLQKIAARCMTMAQSGQYNYARTLARGEYVAARMAEAEFIGAAVSMVFLLNRRYMPFYKWMHRALAGLPILGPEVHLLLAQLVHDDGLYRDRIQLVEIICSLVVGELRRQELSDAASGFLLDHGPCVQSKISDITIRSLGPWVDPSEH